MSIVMFIIGIILIIYSVYVINKDINQSKHAMDEMSTIQDQVKEYYNLTEEIIEDFDYIIDTKIDTINNKENKTQIEKEEKTENSDLLLYKEENLNKNGQVELHEKVISLKEIGLTNEEIAKKLNRGIREIDIILKIYKKY